MENISNWKILWKFIGARMKSPIKQPSFVFYFIVIIMLIGSIGFFSELIMNINNNCTFNIENLTSNSANIFIAIIAASSIELIFIKENDLEDPSRKIDIQFMAIAFLIVGFLLWILSIYLKTNGFGLFLSIIGLILSYLYWWISNADNKKIIIPENPKASIGGNQLENTELQGDTTEFKLY